MLWATIFCWITNLKKATFEDLASEFKPIPFKYKVFERKSEKYEVPDSISLSSGISEEFLTMIFE